MTELLWLSIYCGLVLVASLAGGWIPLVIRLTHRRMQIALSFVAGVMLGVGLLHLLPQLVRSDGHHLADVRWPGRTFDQAANDRRRVGAQAVRFVFQPLL